jgi:hypothetical protein
MWGLSQISERVVDSGFCSYEKYVHLLAVSAEGKVIPPGI